jgi:hypothetical protein
MGVAAHITEVEVAWPQVDRSPESGRNRPWCMVFNRKMGNMERGRRRCLPGTPLGRVGSGGSGRRSATSFTALGHRWGPPVIGLLWE